MCVCEGGKVGMRQDPDGVGEGEERRGELRAVLSDICTVQGVKRVICHLIEKPVCGRK